MLSYETAVKLKDAGFNQKTSNCHGFYYRIGYPGYILSEHKEGMEKHFVYTPTLSELIEVCGTKFETLHWNAESDWWAGDYDWYDHEWVNLEKGSSPEEAVAALWLAINKK